MAQRQRCLAVIAALCSLVPGVRAASVPRKSPDFIVNLDGGKQLPLSQYKGKAVVLAFILTTCPHCRNTMGLLVKDQNELGSRGLQVVASAIEQAAASNVPGFIESLKPSFPVGFNTDQHAILDYLQHPPMLMLHMPVLVFIDRQGEIRAQYEGNDSFMADEKQDQNIRDGIEELLGSGAPGGKGAPRKAPVHRK
jgi:peroxiredoxin